MLEFFESTTDEEQTTEAVAEDLQETDTLEATTEEETVENKTVEDGEESEEDQPEPELQSVSLTLDGTEYNLTLPKAIADEVKNGLLMQADYTRGKQKLSDEAKEGAKEIESRKSELDTALGELRNQLEFEQKELNSEEMQELKEYDSEAYYKKMNAFNERVNKYNEHLKARNEEAEKAHKDLIQKEMDSYPEHIPSWLDESVKSKELQMIGEYLKGQGFEDSDFSNLYPAKYMKVLRSAALHDKAVKSGQSKRKETPPSSTNPRSTNQPNPKKEASLYELFSAQTKNN